MNPYDDLANRGHVTDAGCPCKPCQEYFAPKLTDQSFVTHGSENGLVFRHHISAKPRCWLCCAPDAPKSAVSPDDPDLD